MIKAFYLLQFLLRPQPAYAHIKPITTRIGLYLIPDFIHTSNKHFYEEPFTAYYLLKRELKLNFCALQSLT
jgi:hypothetical protein